MEDSFHIAPHAGEAALKKKHDLLRDQLAKLHEERVFALETEGPNLLSAYYRDVGYLEVECLELEFHIARSLREIACITAALNRSEPVDLAAIHRQLGEEFREWQDRINRENRKLEAARERLSSLMGTKETAELRKRYRALTMQLHPDIHPERHPAMRNLWERLQTAYKNGDLEELELIGMLVENSDTSAADDSPGNGIGEEITRLKKLCQSLIDQLSRIRKEPPHTFRELLEDPEAVALKKSELEDQRVDLKKRAAALKDYLIHLTDGAHP